MFEAKQALFLYCISPVHMGAGTAIGLIDNPIQRERHTEYPLFAGAGLKGAVRHHFWSQGESSHVLLNRLFGPDSGQNASDHAGAVSFGDAQLVAFPVRSLKNGFVYVTSPLALARLKRLLTVCGGAAKWAVPVVDKNNAKCVNPDLLGGDAIALETYTFVGQIDKELRAISEWLAGNVLPGEDAYHFFRDKLKDDLVLLHDEDFGYFVRNATVVEPHVRIDDNTGTAEDRGLFYTENLPPESLLVAPLMASVERTSKADDRKSADDILKIVLKGTESDGNGFGGLNGQLIQIGGDATTGRGQVLFHAVESNQESSDAQS